MKLTIENLEILHSIVFAANSLAQRTGKDIDVYLQNNEIIIHKDNIKLKSELNNDALFNLYLKLGV